MLLKKAGLYSYAYTAEEIQLFHTGLLVSAAELTETRDHCHGQQLT